MFQGKITADIVCKLSAHEFYTVSWIVGGAKVRVSIILPGIHLTEVKDRLFTFNTHRKSPISKIDMLEFVKIECHFNK